MLQVDRVARARRNVGCKLGRDRLAENDGAGPPQGRDTSRIIGRLTPFEHVAAVLGRHVGGVDDVLEADGNAVQRSDALALLVLCVGGPGLLQCPIPVEKRPGLNRRLQRGDAVETGADEVLGQQLAIGDACRSLHSRESR